MRVRDGRIAEIGPDLGDPDDGTGELVVDAVGAYVTPGLIESHTHFDAAVWWDADCDPMPAHGCTTMVMANCGLGLAPLHAADRDPRSGRPVRLHRGHPGRGVQPRACRGRGTPGREYFTAAAEHPTAVNNVGFMPYQMLRTWIMGPDAWERPATADERDDLVAVLDEALAAGALGLSTSVMDTDKGNRPVPSRLADDAELSALIDVLARRGAISAVRAALPAARVPRTTSSGCRG